MIDEYYVYKRWESLDQKLKEGNFYLNRNHRIEALLISKNSIFISNNIDGNRQIYIEFNPIDLRDYLPLQINGLSISIIEKLDLSVNSIYLVISLTDLSLDEAFLAFTTSIVLRIQDSISSLDTIMKIEKIFKAYLDFFSKKTSEVLTDIQEQGLFAELYELNNQMQLKSDDIVMNWEGPSMGRRDFVFDDYEIEIKSSIKLNDRTIMITSENQLEPLILPVYLHFYALEKINNGETIIDLSQSIMAKLTNINLKRIFIGKLFSLGIDIQTYIPHNRYRVVKIISYLIDENFPRIKKAHIPTEVFDIRYKLDLKSIKGDPIFDGQAN